MEKKEGHTIDMHLPALKSRADKFLAALASTTLVFVGSVIWVLTAQNIENLSSERGYDKLLSRHIGEVFAWMNENIFVLTMATSALSGGVICTIIYAACRSRDISSAIRHASFDLDDLSDRLDQLANNIYKMTAELQSRPPTHPDFDLAGAQSAAEIHARTLQWQRDNFNRSESVVRRYISDYATTTWALIEITQKYVAITETEVWKIRNISSASDVEETARLLARLAGRIRAIEPASPTSE